MLKIRLSRQGRKSLPLYHIVIANNRSPRDSKYIEKLGTYSPILSNNNPARLTYSKDRVEYWKSIGAIPSEVVARLIPWIRNKQVKR